MEKVYNIYVDGKAEYQNISLEEEDATIEKFIDCISTLDADDHDKEVLSAIENGASIEIVDATEKPVYDAIVAAIVKELHDKNPDLDTIKMCVRIAIAGCSIKWTTDELIEMTYEIADAIPFDPLSPCKLI